MRLIRLTLDGRASALALTLAAACATPGPADVAARYDDAMRRGDGDALWQLSDHRTQARLTPDQLRDAASRADELSGALATPRDSWRVTASVSLPHGRSVALVEEGGEWRVVDGVAPPADDTPSGALAAFFAAVSQKNWPAVRRRIPRRFAGRFADDAALAAHVEAMAARIDAARAGVEGEATIDGSKASLRWADHRAVRLEREDGRWVIVDLE